MLTLYPYERKLQFFSHKKESLGRSFLDVLTWLTDVLILCVKKCIVCISWSVCWWLFLSRLSHEWCSAVVGEALSFAMIPTRAVSIQYVCSLSFQRETEWQANTEATVPLINSYSPTCTCHMVNFYKFYTSIFHFTALGSIKGDFMYRNVWLFAVNMANETFPKV